MRFMRLAACAVAFAVVGGIAVAEDMDIKALQAKLAAQEARLNDLQAKMGSGAAATPANIVSMKKNAKVTVGGTVDTRYVFGNGDVETLRQTQSTQGDDGAGTNGYQVDRFDGDGYTVSDAGTGNGTPVATAWRTKSYNTGNLFVDSANVYVQAEVNENFDALIRINGHDHNRASGIAQQAWFRWKNICNSGWGVKVGRDALTFALGKPVGMFDAWMQDNGGQSMGSLDDIDTQEFVKDRLDNGASVGSGLDLSNGADINGNANRVGDESTVNGTRTQNFEGMFRNGTTLPSHFAYGVSRVMQINPYWESQDGKYRFDFTFFQGMDSRDGTYMQADDRDGDRYSTNYGLGSAAVKFTWKPSEDWTIAAAAINMYSDDDDGLVPSYSFHQTNGIGGANSFGRDDTRANENDTVVHLGFNWTPSALCQKLTIWAQANQEWNAGWTQDLDVFAANFGLAYKMTDKLTAFAQGDYMYADNERAVNWAKAEGWRSYIGLNYATSYGVAFEAGWAHDQMDYENNAGVTHTKIKGDTLYLQSAFNF